MFQTIRFKYYKAPSYLSIAYLILNVLRVCSVCVLGIKLQRMINVTSTIQRDQKNQIKHGLKMIFLNKLSGP